jgi:hypothetical protein
MCLTTKCMTIFVWQLPNLWQKVGNCQNNIGSCHIKVGSCQTPIGSCHKFIQSVHKSVRQRPNLWQKVGSCQTPFGSCQIKVGSCITLFGSCYKSWRSCQRNKSFCPLKKSWGRGDLVLRKENWEMSQKLGVVNNFWEFSRKKHTYTPNVGVGTPNFMTEGWELWHTHWDNSQL